MNRGIVLSFAPRASRSAGWTQQELAEFYRVENVLIQSGLAVTTDHGISDEEDPWFVFCRADNDEVIAHFARINGEYVVSSSLFAGAMRGRDFRALIREMLESHPIMLPVRRTHGQKVYLHPAALLTALLASAYLFSNHNHREFSIDTGGSDGKEASWLSSLNKASLFAAVAIAIAWVEHQTDSLSKLFDVTALAQLVHHDDSAQVASTGHDGHTFQAGLGITTLHSVGAQPSDSSGSVKQANAAPVEQHTDGVVPTNKATAQDYTDHSSHLAQADAMTNASPGSANSTDDSNAPHGSGPTPIPAAFEGITGPVGGVNAENATHNGAGGGLPTGSSGFVAPINDALNLIGLESAPGSVQPIVLSTGAVALGTALQQVFTQIGFDPDAAHSLANSATQSVTYSQPNTLAASTPVDSTPSPYIGQSPSSDGLVLQALQEFFHNNAHYEVAMVGPNVVIADTNIADSHSPQYGDYTWEMPDGSTLSVIGILPAHSAAVTA